MVLDPIFLSPRERTVARCLGRVPIVLRTSRIFILAIFNPTAR